MNSEWDNGTLPSTKSTEIEVLSCVHGNHVYKDRWAVAVGVLLTCSSEPTNASIRYTVAVIKEGTTIGRLPWKIQYRSDARYNVHAF